MPAYFTITINIKKSSKYENLFADFIELLKAEGFVFKSGYWGFEEDTLEEIIEWNRDKLKADFELGYTEHYSHDYKQTCWKYKDFSEVRMFIDNERDQEDFRFNIIIPETEIMDWDKERSGYNVKNVDEMKIFLCHLWKWECVAAIQTSLEFSYGPVSFEDIENGEFPSIKPFAIISKKYLKQEYEEMFETLVIGREGVLLFDTNPINCFV